jgi:hypothetical protein
MLETRAVAGARGACWGACLLLAATASSARVASQDARPLPDRDTFVREARERLRLDDEVLARYAYTEREVRTDYDSGKVEKRTEKIYEVHPSVDGSPSYRQLQSVDGVSVSRVALDAAYSKYRRDVAEWQRGRARESASERKRREDRNAADRREGQRLLDDGFRIYDFRVVGRETIRGRPAIVLTFAPHPGVTARVDGAAMLLKVAGRAWVDEEDREMVRLEAHTTDTITYGLGILARLAAGSTGVFERQKVNGEGWLPMRSVIRASGRIALVKRVDLEQLNEYSAYRKFSLDPAPPSSASKTP